MRLGKAVRFVRPRQLDVVYPLFKEAYWSAGFHSSAFVRN